MYIRYKSEPHVTFNSNTKLQGLEMLENIGYILTKDVKGNVYYRNNISLDRYVFTCEKFRHPKRWEWRLHAFSHELPFAVAQLNRTFEIKELRNHKL